MRPSLLLRPCFVDSTFAVARKGFVSTGLSNIAQTLPGVNRIFGFGAKNPVLAYFWKFGESKTTVKFQVERGI